MKIGIIVRTLQIGGMERVAANLADAFQKEDHVVTLMYLKNKPVEILPENKKTDIRLIDLDKKLIVTGVGIIWILLSRFMNAIFRKSLFVWLGLVQSGILARELKKIEKEKGRFDLLIVRGQGTFELIWNFKDKRVIQVCENIFSNLQPGFFNSFYAKLLFNGKKVACVSKGVYDNFQIFEKNSGICPSNVKMITNPVDTKKIKERAVEKLSVMPSYSYLLGLGRFVRQKNFPMLVKAYKILTEQYQIKQNLVLVGAGNQKKNIEELVKKLSLESRVFLPGSTDNPYAWMANADLFVLSSDFEGLGMVILEAFASGTNVVATNSPGGVGDIMQTGRLSNQLSDMTAEGLAGTIHATLIRDFPEKDVNEALNRFQPEQIISDYIHF